MAVPEGSLVAVVERMSLALEKLAEAPSVEAVLEEVLRLAAASLWAEGASVTWREAGGAVRTLGLPGLAPEVAQACGLRLLEGPAVRLGGALREEAGLAGLVPAEGPGALLAVHTPGGGGVLVVWYAAPRGLTPQDARRLELYARLVHLALGRERLVEGARRAAAQARAEAEQAEVLRMARLQEVSEALSAAVTREEVARVLLEHGLGALGALSAAVHLCRPQGGAAELLASRGLDEQARRAFHTLAPGRTPASEALVRGEPLWVESLEQVEAGYPDFVARVRPLPRGAFAFLPLRWEEQVLGVLSFGFAAPRGFSPLERASLLAMARQAAQALERARLYELERQARLEAEAAGRRLQLLADVSEVLGGALEWEAMVAGVARLTLGRFSDWCAVDVWEGDVMRRVLLVHVDPARAAEALQLRQYVKDPRRLPSVVEVLRTGRPLRVSPTSAAELEARSGDVTLARLCGVLGLYSYVVVPLVARGRTLGTMALVRGEAWPEYDAADVALCETLGSRVALAMDNARLLHQARQAEEEIRRGAARLHVLAEVGQLLAEAGLDLDSVLRVVTSKVCEVLCEMCVVWLLDEEEGRWLEAVSVHHVRPEERERLAGELRARRPVDEALARHVVGLGLPLQLPHLTLEEVRAQAPAYGAYAARQGPQGLMAVPLKVRGRVLGSLEVMRHTEDVVCGEEERVLLEGVAARAALAIEDARLYGAATQAVRAREELLSVAGHELKTPLNALQLQIHLLARTAREVMAEPRLAERAERAIHTSERLRLLLDDLLDVGRIRAGRLQLTREEVDLAALARDAVARMGEELARVGCEVAVVVAGPVSGPWDRLRLEQVLINLLSNAAKYAPGAPVEVGVALQGEWARLHVRDGGAGIAPEDQARIFQRFERAPAAQSIRGLGLGLWITRQIVEAHGGRIRVESAPGQGATFVVELPLRVPAPG